LSGFFSTSGQLGPLLAAIAHPSAWEVVK
jgi:hypothetical protein